MEKESMQNRKPMIQEKRYFSEIGTKYGLFFLLVTILQIGIAVIASFRKDLITEEFRLILAYLILIFSTYVIGYPFLRYLLRKIPNERIEQADLGISRFIKGLFCMFGILFIGLVLGQVTNKIINSMLNISASSSSTLEMIANINPIYTAVTVGILGPVFEELIFRKKLIDCTIKYGEGVAILTSGIMFGLFHTSITQFFYATGMGILWAYIYIKTGRIRYSIIYHIINNFTVSVLMVEIVKQLDVLEHGNMSIKMVICLTLIIIIFCFVFIGLFCVIRNIKKIFQIMKRYDFKGAFHFLMTSPGMWFYYVLCFLMIIEGYVK